MESICDELGFAIHTGEIACSKTKVLRVKTESADSVDHLIAIISNLTSTCYYSGECRAQVQGNEYTNIPSLTMVGCE